MFICGHSRLSFLQPCFHSPRQTFSLSPHSQGCKQPAVPASHTGPHTQRERFWGCEGGSGWQWSVYLTFAPCHTEKQCPPAAGHESPPQELVEDANLLAVKFISVVIWICHLLSPVGSIFSIPWTVREVCRVLYSVHVHRWRHVLEGSISNTTYSPCEEPNSRPAIEPYIPSPLTYDITYLLHQAPVQIWVYFWTLFCSSNLF